MRRPNSHRGMVHEADRHFQETPIQNYFTLVRRELAVKASEIE